MRTRPPGPRQLALATAALCILGGLGSYCATHRITDATMPTGADWCNQQLGGGTTLVTGTHDSTIAEIDATGVKDTLCVAAGDHDGTTGAVDPLPASLPVHRVTLDFSGATGNGIAGQGIAYATGFTGVGVRSVTIHSGSTTTNAVIQNRRWLAWWLLPSMLDYKPPKDTATVTYTDGRTSTVNLASLPKG
ncbi:hypothetical protein ACIGXM_28395 [Kitasatospora sp. NPDC052896]|uniref:hypothetical protein n=1 Tax=Kitasatospora sp. NPDC052896 TaxID=3364061 RepID=UPI0037CA723B